MCTFEVKQDCHCYSYHQQHHHHHQVLTFGGPAFSWSIALLVRVQWSVLTESQNDGGLNKIKDRVPVAQQPGGKGSSAAKAVP